jgi:alpha-D-xyloside xylohydrolase
MLHNYVDAVRHAPPMPSYVAGFWQCKNRYRNQTQVLDVARGYRDRNLPLDIITIDYMHWSAWGDWSFNTKCWPDPAGMVAELLDMGVELAVTFWPYLCPGGAHFANFSDAGLLATARGTAAPSPVESWACPMYLTDETNPAARAAIYAAFREGYGKLGIRTVWLDGAEPERSTADNFGNFSMFGGTDTEIGESWILQHVRALADGFASDGLAPDEFMLLPRSTWSGAQRYSAAVWSGDIQSDFATLAQQIVIAQSMGLSGHALWTDDGGGYAGGDPSDPTFQQLIVRWLQASVFFPIMRLHGQRAGGPPDDECGKTGGDNEVWNLAKDADHYDALSAALQLRADLREYTLRVNRVTAETGLPMVRAMVLAFPDDPACAAATPLLESQVRAPRAARRALAARRNPHTTSPLPPPPQWMFGPDFLVAPVLSPDAATRDVFLPDLSAANATWVYFFHGSSLPGGGVVTVDVSDIRHYPVFVRTPTAPPPARANVSSLWSAARNDSVTCVSSLCFADQQPNGGYVPQFAEGAAFASGGAVTIAGVARDLVPLSNFYSTAKLDNADSLAGPPDATYDVEIDNGFVLAAQAPGSVPLTLFTKIYSPTHVDTAAFASAEGAAWAQANGYAATGTAGFVLTEAAAAKVWRR